MLCTCVYQLTQQETGKGSRVCESSPTLHNGKRRRVCRTHACAERLRAGHMGNDLPLSPPLPWTLLVHLPVQLLSVVNSPEKQPGVGGGSWQDLHKKRPWWVTPADPIAAPPRGAGGSTLVTVSRLSSELELLKATVQLGSIQSSPGCLQSECRVGTTAVLMAPVLGHSGTFAQPQRHPQRSSLLVFRIL